MSSIVVAARAAWSAIVAAMPILRRMKAERSIGQNPRADVDDVVDELLDGALGRLGAISPDDTHLDQLANAIGGAFVRPQHFSNRYMREWLSRSDVNAALRRVTKARLVSAQDSSS
jgi:hypothetical protein